jgi:hypothetical protein
MLGDGDQQGVEEKRLVGVRLLAREMKEEKLGEAHPADQVAAQILASHRDRGGIGRRDRRLRLTLFADHHDRCCRMRAPPLRAGLVPGDGIAYCPHSGRSSTMRTTIGASPQHVNSK